MQNGEDPWPAVLGACWASGLGSQGLEFGLMQQAGEEKLFMKNAVEARRRTSHNKNKANQQFLFILTTEIFKNRQIILSSSTRCSSLTFEIISEEEGNEIHMFDAAWFGWKCLTPRCKNPGHSSRANEDLSLSLSTCFEVSLSRTAQPSQRIMRWDPEINKKNFFS